MSKIQTNRYAAVRALAQQYGGVCVLKGSGTLIAQDKNETVWLCDGGNPGMATGGMGDVLTGVIAALWAQGVSPLDAARLGVWAHAQAGDDVAQHGGMIGLLARDLMLPLRVRLNELVGVSNLAGSQKPTMGN